MNIIDMRMHMNFGDATNAFWNAKDSNDATYNVTYVDSHDFGPNKSSVRYAGGTDAWAENMSPMWTFRGVPTLHYGSEVEFQAGKPIDCGPTCPLATTGRAYFGDHLAGSVTAADYGVVSSASGAVAATLEKPLVKHVQRLNQIRRRRCRRASTPPRASAAAWRSSAATPAVRWTASRWSRSPARRRSRASPTAPTATWSPVTRRSSPAAR
ncbi:hypothetical protein GCM10010492_18590 [Saccharothrix mutabilis subsp. mutabilis]|uniref:Uncharacterized protein n=1 Tax=Saccharothrix mutabilis subsp. mutabilis TaxID=66855 RepID=A0ABN0TFY6_9PSEU